MANLVVVCSPILCLVSRGGQSLQDIVAERIIQLISGNGTNLQAIIDAIASDVLQNTTISLVVSNRKNAYGLQRASNAHIKTAYHNLVPYGKDFPDPASRYGQRAREAYDADLARILLEARPTMVVCAGWMHIFSNAFIQPFEQAQIPILNLHPALPGQYDGAKAIERAYDDFVKGITTSTGVMIHYLIREVDRGEPIVTQEVEIRAGDTLENLEERIHTTERALLIEGIKIAIEKQHQQQQQQQQQQSA